MNGSIDLEGVHGTANALDLEWHSTTSVLTSLEWLVNLSYNLYMILYKTIPELLSSQLLKIVQNIIHGPNTPSPLPFSPCVSVKACDYN